MIAVRKTACWTFVVNTRLLVRKWKVKRNRTRKDEEEKERMGKAKERRKRERKQHDKTGL